MYAIQRLHLRQFRIKRKYSAIFKIVTKYFPQTVTAVEVELGEVTSIVGSNEKSLKT